ncbi:MAG: hypothetical protein Q7J59_05070, partial [Elusimicrobiota bacterium]|nr:hypothetical protein [Elusimicrobiota bacterium]
MNEILNKVFLMNTVRTYIICAATLAAGIIALRVIRALIAGRLKKLRERSTVPTDKMRLQSLADRIFLLLYTGVIYFSLGILQLS